MNKAHTFAFRKRDDEDVVGSRGDNTFEYSNDRMGPTKCSGSVGSGSNNSSSDGGDGDQDDVSNTRRSECLFVPVEWKTVKVGDIVFIRNDESIPADILVLASHDKLGFCHIETANLDG